MIARHRQHLVPGIAQPRQEAPGLLKLLDTRALGEVAADDDEVGRGGIHLALHRGHDRLVMRAEMQV